MSFSSVHKISCFEIIFKLFMAGNGSHRQLHNAISQTVASLQKEIRDLGEQIDYLEDSVSFISKFL